MNIHILQMYIIHTNLVCFSVFFFFFLKVWSSSKVSSEMLAPPLKRDPPSADSPSHSQSKGKRSQRAGCVVVGREGVFITAL